MKKLIGYALKNNKGGLLVIDERMPIYWNKAVAKQEAKKYKAEARRVEIVVNYQTVPKFLRD